MAETKAPRHQRAEQRMRELLDHAELPAPDEVRYEFDPDEVVFLWHGPKRALVIELDDWRAYPPAEGVC